MLVVWFAVDERWCVLRRAIPGGRVASLCLAGDGHEGALPYEPLLVTTEHPGELACPACERELRAGTAGAAMAVEPTDPRGCTGLTARWCPRCGDCSCEPYPADQNSLRCPLHNPASDHAEPYDDLRIEESRTPTADLRRRGLELDDMAGPEWDFEGGAG